MLALHALDFGGDQIERMIPRYAHERLCSARRSVGFITVLKKALPHGRKAHAACVVNNVRQRAVQRRRIGIGRRRTNGAKVTVRHINFINSPMTACMDRGHVARRWSLFPIAVARVACTMIGSASEKSS